MATSNAMEQVPRKAIVGPYTYDISFDQEASYDYSYLGVCLYRTRRLKLDPQQSDTELPQTFLHEILHALGNAYEIVEWDRHKTDSDGKVTDKIDLMASALLQFLRNNPDIVTWLQNQK